MTIQELCVKYGTDKTPEIGHSYAPIYDKLLGGRRPKNILEIGIGYKGLMERYVTQYQAGASLRVWRDFFPEARIYGIDNHEEAALDEPRITTLIGNSTDELWVSSLKLPKFDFIIDDGSHEHRDQLKTAMLFMSKLKPGGLYFIEDVAWPSHMMKDLADWNPERLTFGKGDSLILVRP